MSVADLAAEYPKLVLLEGITCLMVPFVCFGQHGRAVCWRWSGRSQKADKQERYNSSVKATVFLATS